MDKKLIVFGSEPDFSDNSRAFWDYVKDNPNYDTFWCIQNEQMYNRMLRQNIACGLYGSELADQKIEEADFFVTSSFEFSYVKKKNQKHISLWHGFPLKLIGYFSSASSDQDFETLKIITSQSDMINATSRFCQLTLSGMFSVDPNKVKVTGFPRNDYLFTENGRDNLRKIIDVEDDSKLIFYLPTMRKGLKQEGQGFEENIFNYKDYDPKKLDEFLENNHAYIVAKLHFADNDYFTKGNFELPKRLILLNTDSLNEQFLTIYHIMNAFDALISDYSSVYVDYLLLNRPVIFSCPDLEEYKRDRGFVVDDPSTLMPGAIIKTQDELICTLENIFKGKDEYKDLREEKMSFFHTYVDGNSSQRVLEQMELSSQLDFDKKFGYLYYPNQSSLSNYYHMDLHSECFVDKGNGFNEEDKIVLEKRADDVHPIIEYDFKNLSNVSSIRLDPDFHGHWILKKIVVKADGNDIDYEIVNGFFYEDCIYFCKPDPQIIIVFKEQQYDEVKISFEVQDLYTDPQTFYEMLDSMMNKNLQLQNEITLMKNSHSWKVTAPLRKLKNHE